MGEHEDEHGKEHAEEETNTEGETHAEAEEPDPHVWHDAENEIQMVKVIQDNLTTAAPANADLYTKNAQALTAELTQVDSWIKS